MTTVARVALWRGDAPFAMGGASEVTPCIEIHHAAPQRATGSAMLILPGGAYTFLSEKSGSTYAKWLAEEGITGCVVHFRLGSQGYRYPALLADAWRALCLVRDRSQEWNVDPRRIGVIGTSAGGHLASLLLTRAGFEILAQGPTNEIDATAAAPALGVLCYPVISMLDPLFHQETRSNFLGEKVGDVALQKQFSSNLQVSPATPPCFLWHTIEDSEVSAEHSRRFADALHANRVPYELHFYEKGAHALGLARSEGLLWSNECIRWLRSHDF
jgi:acetyl esterase/lipase